MAGFGTGAGKGSLPRPVDTKRYEENRAKIDFTAFRKELQAERERKKDDKKK